MTTEQLEDDARIWAATKADGSWDEITPIIRPAAWYEDCVKIKARNHEDVPQRIVGKFVRTFVRECGVHRGWTARAELLWNGEDGRHVQLTISGLKRPIDPQYKQGPILL